MSITLDAILANPEGYLGVNLLEIPEETKAIIRELTDHPRKGAVGRLSGGGYCSYLERGQKEGGKEKGEDIFNNICSVFEPVYQFLYEFLQAVEFAKEYQELSTACEQISYGIKAFQEVRTITGTKYDSVRTIPTQWVLDAAKGQRTPAEKQKYLVDYNVMIYGGAKSQLDVWRKNAFKYLEDCEQYQVGLMAYFGTEGAVLSNCVDISLLAVLKKRGKYPAILIEYLRELIDRTIALTDCTLDACEIYQRLCF